MVDAESIESKDIFNVKSTEPKEIFSLKMPKKVFNRKNLCANILSRNKDTYVLK